MTEIEMTGGPHCGKTARIPGPLPETFYVPAEIPVSDMWADFPVPNASVMLIDRYRWADRVSPAGRPVYDYTGRI